MARTALTVSDVFSSLLVPLADALHAETGVRFDRPQAYRAVRGAFASALRTGAAFLRSLAARVEPVAEPVPPAAPRTASAAPTPPEPAPVVASKPPAAPLARFAPGLTAPEVKPVRGWKAMESEAAATVSSTAESAKTWSVAVIARVHGIPAKTVRNHLASGALRGTKGADGWAVADADLAAYLLSRRIREDRVRRCATSDVARCRNVPRR